MAVQVKNLDLSLQTGSDNTYYASWDAPVSTVTTTTTSGSFKKGSLVSIKSGATYYNGVAIPSWVANQKWYIYSINGDRAVINKNESGTNSIMSPINTKYLISSSSSGGSTETTVSNIKEYKVVWKYQAGSTVWFNGSSSTVSVEDNRNDTYSPPSNATRIGVWVTPVSKTYTSNNKETSYWTGTAVSKYLYISNTVPKTPSAPSIAIEKYTLTTSLENIEDERADAIQFQVYKGDTLFNTGTVTVLTARAIFKCSVEAGGEYRVRCRACNNVGSDLKGVGIYVYSDWSPYSETKKTIPSTVTGVSCVADSKTSVRVTWHDDKGTSATSYTVEYTNNKLYFDSSSSVSSTTVESTTAYITGLETGYTWYFRVKATNTEGDSGWSEVVSTVVGSKPEPPTTWSLTTTAYVGEEVILYWTHNSEDGSKQKEAEINIDIDGVVTTTTVTSNVADDEEEPVYSYTLDTSTYSDGGKILWKVRTKGVADEYSDWSVQRTINLFAPATLQLTPTYTDDTLTSLPLAFTAVAGPTNQKPISYYISVIAANSYETVDNVGNTELVAAGSKVYSKVIVSSESTLTHSISAGDITLESGQDYTLSVMVSMDSGLTATSIDTFSVEWATSNYISDASIVIDRDTLSAYIAPFCLGEGDTLAEDVTLSVYRREVDGSFTEIATGLENTMVTTVTDPHPSLDLARYRIVTTDTTTGAVEYSDLPGEPVGEPYIVIQWDEEWSNFDYEEDTSPDVPPWNGSIVKLPYNVDVSENVNPDVALVEYIGRSNPVSYYGTQRGETGTWSCVIDKSDKETVYALRRLKSWMGNVYVREPSGIGYWAHIKVSMSIKHLELTIPVSFEITRVEGGM